MFAFSALNLSLQPPEIDGACVWTWRYRCVCIEQAIYMAIYVAATSKKDSEIIWLTTSWRSCTILYRYNVPHCFACAVCLRRPEEEKVNELGYTTTQHCACGTSSSWRRNSDRCVSLDALARFNYQIRALL